MCYYRTSHFNQFTRYLQNEGKINPTEEPKAYSASPYRKPQKLSDRLLWKSECVSVAHRRYRFAENLKN